MRPEKEKTSFDYPLLVRELLEVSAKMGTCKLPAGLYVTATPIGHLGDISLRALITLSSADRIACEDTRNSGSMLAKYGIKKPLLSYHDHNGKLAGAEILKWIQAGEAIALISDAGMPLISDPGYALVKDCIAHEIPVTVIPGANAVLTALAGSGLPTDQFHFAGFLPPKTAARQKSIASLAKIPGSIILYEAPQRLADALLDLGKILGPNRQAVVARELTKLFEDTRRGSLEELATLYADQEVKGEIVIILAPADGAETHSAEDIDAMLKDALKNSSLRDAVQSVSLLTGAKKSDVYDRALEISGKDKK